MPWPAAPRPARPATPHLVTAAGIIAMPLLCSWPARKKFARMKTGEREMRACEKEKKKRATCWHAINYIEVEASTTNACMYAYYCNAPGDERREYDNEFYYQKKITK
jgi:hypothetical protein